MTRKFAKKNGRGEITGYIEMYYSESCGWVTIPEREDEQEVSHEE